MKKIPLGKSGKFALVDDQDYKKLCQWRWRLDKDGYVIRVEKFLENGKVRERRYLMHRQIMETPKGMETDHGDLNRSNNQRYNLRNATRAQNARNRISYRGSSSKFKGVYLHNCGKWAASIWLGKNVHLGLFTKEKDAAKAYNLAATENQDGFRRVNNV